MAVETSLDTNFENDLKLSPDLVASTSHSPKTAEVPLAESSSSITLEFHDGREFFTRLRTSDLQYLIKQAILANVKAQLEKPNFAFDRSRTMFDDSNEPYNAASSSSWLTSRNSRTKSGLEGDDDSQQESESSSSSSSGSTYNLAAKLKLFEKKHDLTASTSTQRKPLSGTSGLKRLLPPAHQKTAAGAVSRNADSSNGKRDKRKILPKTSSSASREFALECDETLESDEEDPDFISGLKSSQDLLRHGILPHHQAGLNASAGTPSRIRGPLQNGLKRPAKRKRSVSEQMIAGILEAESSMPPKLQIRPKKSRGRGNRCRKVYGVNRRDFWCKSCQWKKRCGRFNEDGDLVKGEEHPLGFVGSPD